MPTPQREDEKDGPSNKTFRRGVYQRAMEVNVGLYTNFQKKLSKHPKGALQRRPQSKITGPGVKVGLHKEDEIPIRRPYSNT